MGYQQELKDRARKRFKRNFRIRVGILIILLIIILVSMHLIETYANKSNNNTPETDINKVERIREQDETN